MRHVLIIMFMVLCSFSSFAKKGDYAKNRYGEYEKRVRIEYYRDCVDQKYRHKYQKREVKLSGELALIRAKQRQKIRNRNNSRRRYKPGVNHYPVAWAVR